MARDNPLTSDPPKEIPLKNAPLVRVLAQVRFPTILSIQKLQDNNLVASFQEAIREKYPFSSMDRIQNYTVGSQQIERAEGVIWRFQDKDGIWQISLAPSFLSLDTKRYSSRTEFLKYLEEALIALDQHIKPRACERIGLRYVDRIDLDRIDDINKFIRPEISGILSTEVGNHVDQTFTESLLSLPEHKEKIVARWGKLPRKATIDPAIVEPLDKSTWVLDLDMSISEQINFDVQEIKDKTNDFSKRLYTIFRWIVTEDFLRHFRGNL